VTDNDAGAADDISVIKQ